MTEFRLTQISDTHLSRADRFASLTENFHRISDISTRRGRISSSTAAMCHWTGRPTAAIWNSPKNCTTALPVHCRYLPGNHDIGDNPTALGAAPKQMATEKEWPNSSK